MENPDEPETSRDADEEDSEFSQEVQELLARYKEGTRESLDEAMKMIGSWLSQQGSTMTLHKIREANAKYGVRLKFVTQFWVMYNSQDQSTNSKDLQNKWIGMPFFSLPLNKPAGGGRMSGNISTIAGAELKNVLKFDVWFESWEESFNHDIIESSDLPKIPQDKRGEFLDAIAQMLETSSRFDAEGEIQQLQQYADTIKDLLRVHGFDVKVKSPPAEDFSFYVAGTEERQTAFIHGEAKKAYNLPNRVQPPGTSVELCWFGFASFICKQPHQNLKLTSTVRQALGIGEPKQEGPTIIQSMCSNIVWNLINMKGRKNTNQNEDAAHLRKVTDSIKRKLRRGSVDADDALSIWGAVMKACFETVAKGELYSIVMSLKMMWFLRLDLDDRCIVSITDGIQMGSAGANSKLLKFLAYVHDKKMDKDTQRKWQVALQKENETESPGDKQEEGGNGPPASKQQKLNKSSKKTGNKGGAPGKSHKPNIQQTVNLDSFDDVQGIDEYGIPIPYFDQIRDIVQDLGSGRCGTVRKVRWKNEFAALKWFRHKGEDDRRLPDDIYKHELSVLRSLKPLWGVHVPRLLFHKPWPSNPAIGLQVGEPMPEDMDSWTEEEQNSAALSLKEIRKFGWVQHDCRGSNFVRLTRQDGGWSIAAIDLEDMVWSN